MERSLDGGLPMLTADVDSLKRELEQLLQITESKRGALCPQTTPALPAAPVIKGKPRPPGVFPPRRR